MKKRRHWFLPNDPDVLGLLGRQIEITLEGLDAFAEWAAGDAAAGERVRDAEHRADLAKWELLRAVREAFVMPIDPEDAFALSRGVDTILNHARDVLTESGVMACPPDDGIAQMAALLAQAVRQVDNAIAGLSSQTDQAAEAAGAAIRTERRLEQAYYEGMAALLEVGDMRERISRRELYRRCAQIGETLVDVAERVIYAVVKES